MRFELKHTFEAGVDAVIEGYTDPAFPEYMKQHMKSMSDIRPIDRHDAAGQLKWRLRCVPTPIIRKVGPKEVPPEALAFVQETSFDRAQKRATFRNIAEHHAVVKHLESNGAISFRDLGGRTERVMTGELKIINLPFLLKFLAPIAEQIIYSNAEKLLQEEAQVFTQFLKQRGKA